MQAWKQYTSKEVKPLGWLKRQLEIQAGGLSGNLDKIWPDVRDSAWIGGNREGWERVPYWLDGFIPLAFLLENEDMIARVKRYIDAILAAQKEDGWICPCEEEKRESYDTWAVLLITKVLRVYYECSGDARIPEVLYRVLHNYYSLLKSEKIRLFQWGKFRWYEGFIAIDFVYERYKEAWLLELAEILQKQGADYNAFVDLWKRPRNHWRLETHIVNIAMMLKAEAVSCKLLGQPYTDNAEYLRSVLDRYNGTVYESFTGDECLSGLSPVQGTELCAIVEQMYSYELLYAYTGDPKWAERLEVLAFNALPATISEDMWTHQYVQLSNQIACETFLGNPPFRTNNAEAHLFGLEPNYGCCTANFNQGWPKFALSTFMHQDDRVISCTYTVESQCDFTFMIRIPTFACHLTVDGAEAEGNMLSFAVKAGECRQIGIRFDVKPCLECRPNDLYAVKWGSLIFCVPIQFEKRMREYVKGGVERKFPYCDYEYIPVSDWNYAYCSDVLRVNNKGVGTIPFSGEEPPVTVKAQVKPINWGLADGYESFCAKVPESLEPIAAAREIELYPYGCAKLRMTELPVID